MGTVAYRVAALHFSYVRTLKRLAMREDLPYPNASRHTRTLPAILTPDEVSRLIDSARNLFHYAMLLTMYSAGLRRSEFCKLKVSNIDSGRMVIRVERGRGGATCNMSFHMGSCAFASLVSLPTGSVQRALL